MSIGYDMNFGSFEMLEKLFGSCTDASVERRIVDGRIGVLEWIHRYLRNHHMYREVCRSVRQAGCEKGIGETEGIGLECLP